MSNLHDQTYEKVTANQPEHDGPFTTRCASCRKELEFERRPDTGHLTLCTNCIDPGVEAEALQLFGYRYSSMKARRDSLAEQLTEQSWDMQDLVLETYLKGYSLDKLGKQADISRQRIAQMRDAAMERRQTNEGSG